MFSECGLCTWPEVVRLVTSALQNSAGFGEEIPILRSNIIILPCSKEDLFLWVFIYLIPSVSVSNCMEKIMLWV